MSFKKIILSLGIVVAIGSIFACSKDKPISEFTPEDFIEHVKEADVVFELNSPDGMVIIDTAIANKYLDKIYRELNIDMDLLEQLEDDAADYSYIEEGGKHFVTISNDDTVPVEAVAQITEDKSVKFISYKFAEVEFTIDEIANLLPWKFVAENLFRPLLLNTIKLYNEVSKPLFEAFQITDKKAIGESIASFIRFSMDQNVETGTVFVEQAAIAFLNNIEMIVSSPALQDPNAFIANFLSQLPPEITQFMNSADDDVQGNALLSLFFGLESKEELFALLEKEFGANWEEELDALYMPRIDAFVEKVTDLATSIQEYGSVDQVAQMQAIFNEVLSKTTLNSLISKSTFKVAKIPSILRKVQPNMSQSEIDEVMAMFNDPNVMNMPIADLWTAFMPQ